MQSRDVVSDDGVRGTSGAAEGPETSVVYYWAEASSAKTPVYQRSPPRRSYLRRQPRIGEPFAHLARHNPSMTEPNADEIAKLVEQLDNGTLRALLVELAGDHGAVRERIERLGLSAQPRKLAAAFRATLNGWRRSSRYLDYRQSHAFSAELESWLQQVERELMPRDPELALGLFEALIGSDASFFERADDSDGCIADAIRTACRLWLTTAARCKPPPAGWIEPLRQLVRADDYSAREPLLGNADLLLDEQQMRALVAQFEADLDASVQAGVATRALPPSVFMASGSLRLLSEALRDPDIEVRAVLRYSPVPNALQKASFVRAYLDCSRPADALAWLDDQWDCHHEDTRLRLLAQTYADLQRTEDCAVIRQHLFESTGSVEDFVGWRACLPPESHPTAEAAARRRAEAQSDPITAARLLLEIGDAAAAESLLVARYGDIDGKSYPQLVPLAEALDERHCALGATACYRALLLGILTRAYAKAYGHGARYLAKLRQLATEVPDPHPLERHELFEAALKAKHGRKVAFWSQVKAG